MCVVAAKFVDLMAVNWGNPTGFDFCCAILKLLFYVEQGCSQSFEMSGDILKWLYGEWKDSIH